MRKISKVLVFVSIAFILTGCSKEKEKNDTNIPETIKEIYEAKNPHIGDNSADSKLVELLMNYYKINDKYTIELITDKRPYILILHFDSEPDKIKMLDISSCLLALVDNCNEVRWDYEKNKELNTEYVKVKESDVNKNLDMKSVKEYSQSLEKFNLLLEKLEDN
ncbi:DUF4825 domain-containing protein [Anaerosacchariphilus polymeriproducens]|uniref:DUF4825 domain-containing protein n=1 Tax=Anaerosacchariphilus polymeriproducens TaxID=1812858 RepID=A0A371AYY0_9FIRM|nr:DUF4825 domain-containing protein [Anaerosacchariphilus polymeriproducens]RDU24804.1 DUF4825 domain-containing protein [Anaerosacchariphilus polymeriproducens]